MPSVIYVSCSNLTNDSKEGDILIVVVVVVVVIVVVVVVVSGNVGGDGDDNNNSGYSNCFCIYIFCLPAFMHILPLI